MKILLVEDDQLLANALSIALTRESYLITHVTTAKEAINQIKYTEYQSMILDLGLPDMDGIDVLKRIRKQKIDLPILILTARDSIEDKIKGLDLGADDYLSKPFEVPELLARLRVIERRLGTANSALITIKNVTFDTRANVVTVDTHPLVLSKKEYLVLKALVENAGRIQSREQLEAKLYEWQDDIASNTVEVHIHHLRKKLPANFIKNIRGIGYSIDKA
ncbi:response regulator [Algibacillus agarilyticus]|uniref:response regulator n=1 Tax=Algibacillus agarilyticus TaxID=2234133 RepID=UPI000DCFAD4A|nr:response regulator [Algibacillus agarilyticus]